MGDWQKIADAAQVALDKGDASEAIRLFRHGLATYGSIELAKSWLSFRLLHCLAIHRGFAEANAVLPDVIGGVLSWDIKLFALDAVLSLADAKADYIDQLHADTLRIVKMYLEADIGPQDVNLISSQRVAQLAASLFRGRRLSPYFDSAEDEERFPVIAISAAPPYRLDQPSMCNRPPQQLRLAIDMQRPPERPLGFRHVGKAYVLRLGANTIVFDEEGSPLDTPYGPQPAFLKAILRKRFRSLEVRGTETRPSLFIGDFFSQVPNYCHWLLDSMMRVATTHDVGLEFGCVVGAFKADAPYQTRSLELLLRPGQSYVAVGEEDGLQAFDDFYYADNAGPRYIRHPAYGGDRGRLESLRNRLMAQTPSPQRRKRLFVPRRHNRIVLNDGEVRARLEAHGFETIDTDAMTLDAQIEAFASAEALVAPHGAALAGLLFAPADCRVLELFPPYGGSASFFHLAAACGHDYSCFIDDVSQGPNRDAAAGILNNTANIHVDIAFLDAWLDGASFRDLATGPGVATL